MSCGKRAHGGPTTCSKKYKRQVTITTFNKQKYHFELEREHQTLSWLCCDVDTEDKIRVAALWCQASLTHEHSITGMKNFWIVGSRNQKTSNIVDGRFSLTTLARKF